MSQYNQKFDFKKKCGIQWSTFHVPGIMSFILMSISYIPYFLIMYQYEVQFDVKVNVGRSELYDMT